MIGCRIQRRMFSYWGHGGTVDAMDLKSIAERRAGSSPAVPTKEFNTMKDYTTIGFGILSLNHFVILSNITPMDRSNDMEI